MAQTVDPKAYYGNLFAQKQPTKLLDALLRGIANYISVSVGDKDDKNLSPPKLATFYKAVGGNYDSLFVEVPHSSISWIYASIGCQHTLQPTPDEFKPPSIPALTIRGFVHWQAIEILLGPEEHVPFIQYAVNNFDIKNPDTGESFPKEIPKEAFPLKPDAEIVAWHSKCAEKLRQQAIPNQEEQHLKHNISPRPKVKTGYAHIRPTYPLPRVRPEVRDYFVPSSKPGLRPIPYQHVAGTGRPSRPGLSNSPTHRKHQFMAPEEIVSPRSGRPRRRSSFPDASSPLTSPQAVDSPTLGSPGSNDHIRRHSHPRHARRGSCSSDASSECEDPPSPRTGSRGPGTARPHRPHPKDSPNIRFSYASPPSVSPSIPASPNSRPRTRDDRDREEEAKRRSYPIPIDLSGKLSAPFLLGRKDREKQPGSNSRGAKVGWKDLSSAQNALHQQSSKSSEDNHERDREGTGRRHSRDERERDSGSSDYKRRDRDKDRDRDRERERERDKDRPSRNRHSSHEDTLPKRERERDRDRDRERDRVRERERERDGDKDRDRDRDADGRAYRDRYYTSPR